MAEGIPARLGAAPASPKPLGRGREWAIRLILLTGSLVFALGLAEVVARAFFPLNDGRSNVDMNGQPITDWFTPGSVYRQISNEYDAVTTITGKGHRAPGVAGDASPEIVFLGDSFTFGYGLKDDETFAGIYCTDLKRACANLGIPGSGTSRQVKRLEEFITKWGWTPREVKLFFFGMSGSFSAGNDFADNYGYGRYIEGEAQAAPAQPSAAAPGLAARVIASQRSLLEHSYLMRRAKYHWGPMMKSFIVVEPGDRMTQALEYTRRGFGELDAAARRYGFDYKVYLIVPVQDIIRGTYPETLATLNQVATKPAIATAQLFVDSPTRFYYAYDGHLNPLGSRRIAEYLISLDSPK